MIYDFDQIHNRRTTESIKWNAYEADVLPMWIADMDFVSPTPVINALVERSRQGIFGYPRYAAELRNILVERMATRYSWEIQPEDLVFLPGVVTGFNLACHTFASQPGNVVVQTPLYTPMLSAPENVGLSRSDTALHINPDGSYAIDWEILEKKITAETRMFMLCNPHNPTGRVFRQDELEHLAELCLSRGVPICSDEIHSDLVYSEFRHIPIASLDPEIARQTITLIAPSKTFNIAGLQFSAAIIPDPDLRQRFQRAGRGLVSWVNLMGITAAHAAYQDGQEWLDQLLPYLQANRDKLVEYVHNRLPGIRMAKPEGTYLAWLDCRSLDLPDGPYTFFLKEALIAFNDGESFGPGGAGFIRLNFGCPRSVLNEALNRIEQALQTFLALDKTTELTGMRL
jgi:cysteine-S-conjugate beta-lyase